MWKSLSIPKKIWVSLFILLFGYLFSMIMGFVNSQNTQERLSDSAKYLFPAARKSQAVLTAFNEQIRLYNDAVLFGGESLMESAREKSDEAIKLFKEITELPGISDEKAGMVEKASGQLKTFTTKAQVVYTAMSVSIENKEEEESENDYGEDLYNLAQQTNIIKKDLTNISEKFAEDHNNELASISKDTKHSNYRLLGGFVFVAILTIVINMIIISQSISRPLANTVSMLKDIAEGEGDLTKRLTIINNDEAGELAKWFNSFIGSLQKIIEDITGKAETLSQSSEDLSALSSQMTAGANQVSERSNVVSNSAEEMNTSMDSIAAAMEQTSSNTNVVANAIEEMTSTINEISKNSDQAASITDKAVMQAQDASQKVIELGEAATEIGKVTAAIADISEQTNLLALNATIEAARAGDSGRGFAVVANEIKELSMQTAEATQDIKQKVEGIQGTTEGTISVIEQISKVINDVNEIVAVIAASVEEQSVTTKEIANIVVQLSEGINTATANVTQSSVVSGQIAGDISEVNQATGEMSNSSTQINLSAEKLSKMAVQLKELMGQFKI